MNTLIIAEAGVNHNGSINYARKLIDIAIDSGADYVKFQTFVTDENITRNASKAYYQLSNNDNKESQFEMLKKLELDKKTHLELLHFAQIKIEERKIVETKDRAKALKICQK